jgi:hypothetical protein
VCLCHVSACEAAGRGGALLGLAGEGEVEADEGSLGLGMETFEVDRGEGGDGAWFAIDGLLGGWRERRSWFTLSGCVKPAHEGTRAC